MHGVCVMQRGHSSRLVYVFRTVIKVSLPEGECFLSVLVWYMCKDVKSRESGTKPLLHHSSPRAVPLVLVLSPWRLRGPVDSGHKNALPSVCPFCSIPAWPNNWAILLPYLESLFPSILCVPILVEFL